MIRVLHLLPGLGLGGISSVILNYYQNLDQTQIQFDFAVFNPVIGYNGKIFESLGSKIYVLPEKTKNFIRYIKELKKIIINGNYDVVHAHQNYMSFIPLFVAKKLGVKKRFSHSHSAYLVSNNIVDKISLRLSKYFNILFATKQLACGNDAAKLCYGNKALAKNDVEILYNAIDLEKYKFNEQFRNEIRENLNLSNKIIMGTVARISKEKNLNLLINVFLSLPNKENYRCLIVGDGEERVKLEEIIFQKKLKDFFIFVGNKEDAFKYYSAFDVFMLPSFREGFPVSVVEAIANGLPCILSNKITKEFENYKGVQYLSINDENEWQKEILKLKKIRYDNFNALAQNGLEIKIAAKRLEELYKG